MRLFAEDAACVSKLRQRVQVAIRLMDRSDQYDKDSHAAILIFPWAFPIRPLPPTGTMGYLRPHYVLASPSCGTSSREATFNEHHPELLGPWLHRRLKGRPHCYQTSTSCACELEGGTESLLKRRHTDQGGMVSVSRQIYTAADS